jgi:hypothetical protein
MSSATSIAGKVRGFDLESVYAGPARGSAAAGTVAASIASAFDDIEHRLTETRLRVLSPPEPATDRPAAERLFNVLVNAKVFTAQVAMHLDRNWRNKLFANLDDLLDPNDWHEDDEPMLSSSFATFLRMILHIRPVRSPSLGLSNQGHLMAAWTSGENRLALECLPQDLIRWSVSCKIDEELERAVGETPVRRVLAVLAPYGPERWFANAPDAAAPR